MKFKVLKTEGGTALDDVSQNDFFVKMLLGEDCVETIETSRGTFEVKFPKQKDLIKISQLTAYRRGGVNIRCFDNASEVRNTVISTLDVLVVDGSGFYKNVKKENNTFNWEDMPDYAFCEELYMKVCTFRDEVQRKLDEGKPKGLDNATATEGDNASMDDGAFQGLTNETEETD